jgi:flagellar hook-length control protein FliK
VTPASVDASSAPVLPVAPFSVPATVVPAPTTGPTASAPAVPTPPVPAQVLAAVSPFVRGDDGSYAVQLQLHPHDLGAVQVTVDVRHGEISVQLHTPDTAAQDALRDGLADLRRQLEEQGLRTGSMEVGSGGPQQHRENTRRQPVGLVVRGTGTVASRPGPATGGSTTALDLRM